MSLKDLIERFKQLKNSPQQEKQELLSCILLNLIDEVRFFNHFPEKELMQTADLFGYIIKEKIVDGIIQGIYVDCLLDKIGENEKLRNFSLTALRHIISSPSLYDID